MIVLDLIYNLSILVSLSILSGFISKRWYKTFVSQIMQGLLFGSVAIIGMLYPFVFAEGIIFDGRSIVISLCTLFFGPIAGIVSVLMASLYRIILGGGGVVMGLSVISSAFLIGLGFHNWLKRNPEKKITNYNLYLFGLLVHIAMIIFLSTLPSPSILNALMEVGVTIFVAYPLATLLIGKILLDQENAITSLNTLQQRESLLRTTLYSIGDGVIVINNNNKVTMANPIAEHLIGWSEFEAKSKSLEDIFHIINEDTREIVENPVDKVLREGVVVGLANHTLLISKDGKEIPIADSGAPIRNENGEIIGVVLVFRDQTEERLFQKELDRREKKYRSLYNSIRDAILVTDTSRNIIDYNPAFLDMFEYSAKELDDQKTKIIYKDKDEFEKLGIDLNERSSNRKFIKTINYKRKNGTVFPGETNIFSMEDDQGNKTGHILLIRDITERKLAEAALLESEERYSSIFKDSLAVMLLIEPDTGQIIDANNAALDYYGYPKDVLLAKKISEINVLPEQEIFNEIEKIRNGTQNHFIFKHKLISGELRDVEVYSGKLILKGKELLYSIVHDITEKMKIEKALREGEDKMRLLVEGTPYLFFYTQDLEANITYVSPSIEKITGRTVEDWMGQKHWWVTNNPINEEAKKRTRTNLKGEFSREATWVEVTHKNGNPIMLEIYENPVIRDGHVVSLQGVAHDITVREKMIAELQSAKDSAEAASKLKTEFLAQMSHEIRSPLNAVLSFTSLLEEGFPDKNNEEVKSIFLGIVSSGNRIIKTIDSILNMSELQLGIYEVYLRNINLEEVITSLFLEYRNQAKSKNISLIKSIKLENPVIKSDDYAVTQVIANLLDNAIKYTSKGSVLISLYPDTENKIVLEVKDTGIGIAKEYLPFLFEEFSQEQQGYSRMFEGNGLGLALVKKYCELIGAEINVESEKGKGSSFKVTFQQKD